MVNVDWERPENTLPRPGIHFARVDKCELKKSKNGDDMFVVDLVEGNFGGKLIRDWIMLEGKMWGAGKHALIALGLGGQASIEPMDLVGKTAYVCIKHEPYSFIDKKSGKEIERLDAKVDKQATDPWCGYLPPDKIPEGYDPESPF